MITKEQTAKWRSYAVGRLDDPQAYVHVCINDRTGAFALVFWEWDDFHEEFRRSGAIECRDEGTADTILAHEGYPRMDNLKLIPVKE